MTMFLQMNRELSKINGQSGALVQTYPFDPLVMTEANGTVWFLTSNQGTRVFAQSIDQTQNRLTHAIPIMKLGALVGSSGDVLRIAAGGNALWI